MPPRTKRFQTIGSIAGYSVCAGLFVNLLVAGLVAAAYFFNPLYRIQIEHIPLDQWILTAVRAFLTGIALMLCTLLMWKWQDEHK